MKPFQRYLMKSIRTIMQYNLYSERQSISLAPCRDQQVPYLKVPGITKYTLRFIYERSKTQTKDRLIQPRLAGRLLCSKHYIFYLHWLKQGSTKSKKKKKWKKSPYCDEIWGTVQISRDLIPYVVSWFLSLSNCKTNRLRHLSVWCFLFSHYGN